MKNRASVAVIMRSYNDVNVIRATLEMLKRQTYQDFELWSFDSSSTDGTREIIAEYNVPERIFTNDPRKYIPGNILNEAMLISGSELVVFINSDATPEHENWLEKLIQPFSDPLVGAVYGRQTSRPDCRSLFVKDNERAFGDGLAAASWVHFFSMANSAVRREVWEKFSFETAIQYSEDIEWSYRIKKAGYKVVYVMEAAAVHSHNYTLRQSYKRHMGEGKAEAWIFRENELNQSFLRYFLLPLGMEVLRDFAWALRHLSLEAMIHSIPLRVAQKLGRWEGLRQGRELYGKG